MINDKELVFKELINLVEKLKSLSEVIYDAEQERFIERAQEKLLDAVSDAYSRTHNWTFRKKITAQIDLYKCDNCNIDGYKGKIEYYVAPQNLNLCPGFKLKELLK